MPEFYYEAYLQNGRTDRSTIVASDRHAAHAALSAAGKMPFVLKPVSDGTSARAGRPKIRLPRRSGKARFQRLFVDLSVLLNSGFTIDQAISVVTADKHDNAEIALYRRILDKLIDRGWTRVDEPVRISKISKLFIALRYGLF